MAPNTAAELSLINDTEFLGELQAFAPETDGGFDQETRPRLTVGDAFDALENGLPTAALTAEPDEAPHEFVPVDEPYDGDRSAASARPSDTRVTFIAAALVLVACLAAGAVTAAVVFRDRVAQITASR